MQPNTSLRPSFLREFRDAERGLRAPGTVSVEVFWRLGRLIAEEEASALVPAARLTEALSTEFKTLPLREFHSFYLAFPEWSEAMPELSWSHYRLLMRIRNGQKRVFYWKEALKDQWSVRELARQIHSWYCERAAALRVWEGGHPGAIIKEPYVLEFLPAQKKGPGLEKDLESALLERLQDFLLELGKGFAFVARQKRLSTVSGKRFYIDLVFYHYLLKCFVLVDLKTGELTHRDIGQMDMYVRFFEEKWRGPTDNPTLGLILCAEKDHTVVKYSMLRESRNLFASTYQFHLPTEEELSALIHR